MRMRGLEPPRPEGHGDLNAARLPIPPHPRADGPIYLSAAQGPFPTCRHQPTGHDARANRTGGPGSADSASSSLLQTLEPLPQETAEEAAYRAAVDAAVAVLEAYDDDTAEHSDDVVTVSEAIADRLNVTGDERRHLHAVAQLHDIGKVTVPPEILNKPGPLDEHEWRVMRRHTIEGEQILAAVPGDHSCRAPGEGVPRALRRHGLSRRPRGRGHPADRPHRFLRRRVPRHPVRPSISSWQVRRRRAGGDPRQRGHAVRPGRGRRARRGAQRRGSRAPWRWDAAGGSDRAQQATGRAARGAHCERQRDGRDGRLQERPRGRLKGRDRATAAGTVPVRRRGGGLLRSRRERRPAGPRAARPSW